MRFKKSTQRASRSASLDRALRRDLETTVKKARRVADREAELLPMPYYHVVFTLPAAIADIAYQNKAVVYDLLFKVSAETMLTIAADPKHLGARIGITSVLHTWGSALTHHPHAHMIVPGGGSGEFRLEGEAEQEARRVKVAACALLEPDVVLSCRDRYDAYTREVVSRLIVDAFLNQFVSPSRASRHAD